MTKKTFCALLLAGLLGACTGYQTPTGPDVCSTQPGTWDCQVEQYQKVNTP